MEIKKFENFIPSVPAGWINVKIDDQLFIRISRYVIGLDNLLKCSKSKDKYNLFKKIEALSTIGYYIDNDDISIQTKISVITLLQYLKEIKEYFNPSSAGFLLEGFLAALIHGKLTEPYANVDITSSYNELYPLNFKTEGGKPLTYQIKLYKKSGNIKVNMNEACDYYVICLKDVDSRIQVHILDGKNKTDPSFIGKYAVNILNTNRYMRYENDKSYLLISINKLIRNSISSNLNMRNIDELIKKCGESIKNSIEKVYNHLSELHYDVDSLITGIDKNRKKIDLDQAKENADETIENISYEISNLKKEMKPI